MQAFPAELGVANPGPIQFFVSFSPFDSHRGGSMAVFAAKLPAWRPGTRPLVDPAHDVQPGLPSSALNADAGDSAAIQFVVDEHGAPVDGTMRLLHATRMEYAQAVVNAAIHSQYIPATAVGCPVKGLIDRSWRAAAGQQ